MFSKFDDSTPFEDNYDASLQEILAEPIIQLVMARDGVKAADVQQLVARVARQRDRSLWLRVLDRHSEDKQAA